MRLRRTLTWFGCAAASSAPYLGFAGPIGGPENDDFRLSVDPSLRQGTTYLTQRNTNQATGNTLIVIGAVILLGGLGSGSGVGQVLTLGAGGFLIALGHNGEPTLDPWGTGLKMGYWRGAPTASYTLFRF